MDLFLRQGDVEREIEKRVGWYILYGDEAKEDVETKKGRARHSRSRREV